MQSTVLQDEYHPSPRIQRLRARVLAQGNDQYFDPWLHAFFFIEGWMAADGAPLAVRACEASAHVIEGMPIGLREGDLLAGEHGMRDSFCPWHFWGGIPPNFREEIAASSLTPEQQKCLCGWLAADPFACRRTISVAPHPPELQLAWQHCVVEGWGTDINHSVRAYEKVLRLGFTGLRAEVDAALAACSPTEPDVPVRRANLAGWQRLCDAAMAMGTRHAAAVREKAVQCDDPSARVEWLALADVCERVPAQPARTFREAVQALWFAHMLTCWEDGVNANSIGRIDQILWPYLEADLAAGRTTLDEAREILAALWIKLYQPYDVQQATIGGQLADGRDATNPLSYLVLDVTEGLGFVRCLSARLHKESPRELVARCVDLVSRGGGIPFFFNDEAIIPALTAKGIPLGDARGYSIIGCIEITIPGKANPHAVSHWVNLAKILELALNDGCDMLDGAQVGPRTGTLADFRSIDGVLAAYTTQLRYFTELAAYLSNSTELAHREQYRLPYLSLLTDDCVARGLDIIEGGARYNYHSSAAMGIPNVADSLAAIEQAVFIDGKVTQNELLEALRTNFAGCEELRLYLQNRLPKYGNDLPLPDRYAAEIARQYCELLGSYPTVTGGTFFTHLFTFTLMIPHGKGTGALPDGRPARAPLAYSLSPMQGRDREGFTAVINSLSRIPHHLAAASSSAILEADPTMFQGDGKTAFVELLRAAIAQGVGQLQFNVVNADTLRAAQQCPEQYRNLCVRVSGFSQQFNLLDRDMQDHIIARTKHRN